jgi:hypothetical protein
MSMPLVARRTRAPARERASAVHAATGTVSLNADGRQYNASYELHAGIMTVTFGITQRVVRVGDTVPFPTSLARTILRTMVRQSVAEAGH